MHLSILLTEFYPDFISLAETPRLRKSCDNRLLIVGQNYMKYLELIL